MKLKINQEIEIDLEKLISGKLLIQANSGGGKSWLIRRIVEQAYGKVQIIILDPEGEFSTLREKFDFVLAGKGGDTPAESKSASLLARKLLELKVSTIIDLYELHPQERKHFVKLFLDSMINAPKELYHDVLVVLDEAHMFAPEKDQSEASSSVVDMASRGRKRGYSLVLATQRISKLAKDAAAECNNKLIGRTSLDIDRKRASEELGITSKEETLALRSLRPGEFFAFGPAISDEVIKIKVGDVQTSVPKAGSLIKVTPPTEAIKKVLGKLADLPAEAEKEAKTLSELKAENIQLKRQIFHNPQKIFEIDPKITEKAVRLAVLEKDKEIENIKKVHNQNVKFVDGVVRAFKEISDISNRMQETRPENIEIHKIPMTYSMTNKRPRTEELLITNMHIPKKLIRESFPKSSELVENSDLTNPERKILNAIAWMESIGVNEPEQTAVAFLSGYTYGGGAFNNPRGALRTKGMVEYRGNRISLTEIGKQIAEVPDTILTTDELHNKILSILPGPEKKLMEVLLSCYPEEISNEDLAERSGYQVGGGAFNNPRGRLRTLGLIEYKSGMVRARDFLFF